MRRRRFISLIGSAAVTWPFAVHAQQFAKLPTIGFLGVVTPSAWSTWVAAFAQRLRELGWIENRTVAIEYRWTEGRSDRLGEIAADLAQLKVDVIVTAGPAAVIAAKQAMPSTPIVFAIVGDPVGTGLVDSLSRPGGKITGMSMLLTGTASKRIELLQELVPDLRRLAVMANVGFSDSMLEMSEVQRIVRALNLESEYLEIRRAEDIAPAFDRFSGRMQALYVCADPVAFASKTRINTLAQGARLPTIYGLREYVDAGGLVSYGPNVSDLFRRTAEFVDKILRGGRPADIPVEQPTKFELVINLITAKALGFNVPRSLLGRADEVIE